MWTLGSCKSSAQIFWESSSWVQHSKVKWFFKLRVFLLYLHNMCVEGEKASFFILSFYEAFEGERVVSGFSLYVSWSKWGERNYKDLYQKGTFFSNMQTCSYGHSFFCFLFLYFSLINGQMTYLVSYLIFFRSFWSFIF